MRSRAVERKRMRMPAITCPRCGARPALRVCDTLVERVQDLAPEEPVGSYKCQRRACGTIYDIPAGAYQRAQ